LAFSFDNRLLAAGSGGGTLTVWDWEKCLPISHCHGSSFDIFAVAFSPDGVTVASGGRYEAKLWDVATGRLLLNLQQGDFVTGLAFSPYGFRLAVSGQGLFGRANGLIVWGLESGRGIQTLCGLNAVVSRVCFSPDGRFLAALSHNWQVAIWELSTGHLRLLLDVPQGSTADHAALAFSPDGSRFAFSTWGEAKLWDIATGKELKRWLLPEGLHDVLAFHPSGKLLLFRVESVMASPVCRLRDLLGPEPTKAISEDREFNWYVEQLAGSSTGSYFTAMGRRKDPDREGWAIKVLDGLTGKTLWSRPC